VLPGKKKIPLHLPLRKGEGLIKRKLFYYPY
jgi:hypothetical protein